MDIRSFFIKQPGNKNNDTKKPPKKANANTAVVASKTEPKPKSKPKSESTNDTKKSASTSSPYFSQSSSSTPKTKTSSVSTSKKRAAVANNFSINNTRNGNTHVKGTEIDSDATTDDDKNVVRKVASKATKRKPTKEVIDLDATTDEDMDIVRKVPTKATKRKLKKAKVDLDATTDEDTGDTGGKKTFRKKRKVETDSDATTDDYLDTKKTTSLAVTKKAEVDLDATTDDEMQYADKKSVATKKKKAEVDLDMTTDEDEDCNNRANRRKKGQRDLDSTTDEEMEDINKNKTFTKRERAKIESDATTDDDVEITDRKKTKTTIKRKQGATSYSRTHSESKGSRGKRVAGDAKNKKAVLDDDSIEPDDYNDSGSDEDFEVKSSEKERPTSKRGVSSTKSARARRSIHYEDDSDTDDGDDDDDFVLIDNNEESEEEKLASDADDDDLLMASSTAKPSSKSPTKYRTSTNKSKPKPKPRPVAKPKPSPKKKTMREAPIKPTQSLASYPHTSATPQCLSGYTFVLTGNMPDLPRDTAEEYIKILGGRVTKAVSGKTNYLVCGEILEDDRPVEEGVKFKRATSLGENVVCILRGEGEFYGVVKLLDDKKREEGGDDDGGIASTPANVCSSSMLDVKSATKNPYARVKPNNPYAKPTNPYAKRSSLSVSSSIGTSSSSSKPQHASLSNNKENKFSILKDSNALWADKYAPQSTDEILGNRDCVNKLIRWLSSWEDTFNMPQTGHKKRSLGGPTGARKAALLSGPPGIGKTTTAVLVGKESGRHVLEMNASDTRSKKSLEMGLGDVTGSHVLSFKPGPVGGKKSGNSHQQKRCIIMDEVDGMGAGDRSGISELIKMIKTSHVPIICICNDRQSQKIRSLIPYCLDLRYRRPVKTVIGRRAIEVGNMEGMHVEPNAAEAIAESCGNDIRQVLNVMQMWANKKHEDSDQKADMTYKDLKERKSVINKDEILRVSMFDATKLIVEGRRGLEGVDSKTEVNSLFKRTDAFFTDYSLMGLNVHQNYLKVLISPFQKTRVSGDALEELKCLENMSEATRSMSDFAVAENSLRVEQNWSLLPLCSSLAVKCGHHAGGESGGFLPGYPEFAGWLGKNSSRARKLRLLQELSHHMNYKISADGTDLRLGYLPVLREFFVTLLVSGEESQITDAIEFMDEYGLDRDDVFENLDEFTLDSNARKMSDLDSKSKTAFTKEYNKGVHKSQALVDEQGVTKSRKKVPKYDEEDDDDNDDDNANIESEEEDEDDIETLQKRFKKRKSATSRKKK